ncbi:MAG: hypothetical protein Q8Q85_00565 [Gemmatimonadales bacterium]|nr:hypothetical protein [Gemmatimonadales bacterium]
MTRRARSCRVTERRDAKGATTDVLIWRGREVIHALQGQGATMTAGEVRVARARARRECPRWTSKR